VNAQFFARHLILEIKHIAQETFPKSLEFHTDISPELWTISEMHTTTPGVDEPCVNARDAMPDGGFEYLCGESVYRSKLCPMHLEATVGPYIVITVDTGNVTGNSNRI